MSSYPQTIELTDKNIIKYEIYKTDEQYYLKPKRKYKHFTCKGCKKRFLRYSGNLLYCSNKCSSPHVNENNKIDLTIIKKSFEDEGYTLLTTEYKNNNQKLDFICSKGHKHNITWSNWSHIINPQRCGKCAKNTHVSIQQIKELFFNKGYDVILPDKKKIYGNEKLSYICSKGHKHQISYTILKAGQSSCPYCANQAQIKFDTIKRSFEDENYIVLTKEHEYHTQNTTKIDFICPNGHKHSISVRHWRNGRRCGKCRVSKEEGEVRTYLNEINITDYRMNDRSVLLNPNTNHYLELDIWFPKKKKAIEINGIYWHNKQDKINNDKIKKKLCDEFNIDLMIITDYDWHNNKDIIKDNIQKFIQ